MTSYWTHITPPFVCPDGTYEFRIIHGLYQGREVYRQGEFGPFSSKEEALDVRNKTFPNAAELEAAYLKDRRE